MCVVVDSNRLLIAAATPLTARRKPRAFRPRRVNPIVKVVEMAIPMKLAALDDECSNFRLRVLEIERRVASYMLTQSARQNISPTYVTDDKPALLCLLCQQIGTWTIVQVRCIFARQQVGASHAACRVVAIVELSHHTHHRMVCLRGASTSRQRLRLWVDRRNWLTPSWCLASRRSHEQPSSANW